ncbi:mRNA interferase RelE/StbE [Nocardia sp. GAS34]|uniref:type II toxin-antitoxin system RelE family toxin n=1 Tax=unclassified Nocardia TaxID=2637762 RepID=UPI003D1BA6F6
MKYGFEFTPAARRAIRAIPQADALGLLRAITALGNDPYAPNPNIKPMVGDTYTGYYRLRHGNYRAIYRIDDGLLIILVINAGHRRDIYQR